MHNIGDEIEIQVEKIVPRGFGLAFTEKLTVFVALAAPGDHLRVRIKEIRKRTAFAEIVDVIHPSAQRITPPCSYFGRCGGCDFQQMAYGSQLEAKVDMIRDCLRRIAKIEVDSLAIIASPQEFNYRSRAKWHLDRGTKKMGYFRTDSNEVIEVESCPILTPQLQAAMTALRAGFEWENLRVDQSEVAVVSSDEGFQSIYSDNISRPTAEISVESGGEKFIFSAKNFFQGNRFLVEQLIDTAIGDTSGETAIDLFCGVGLFSLPLARVFAKVIGVEDDAAAVGFAKRNAAKAGLNNLIFRRLNVKRFLFETNLTPTDFMLIDPPRAGPEKGTIEKIAELRPKQISYVSCEPSILARDLRTLLNAGYVIEKITALDLFPQTHHVETVVRINSNVDFKLK